MQCRHVMLALFHASALFAGNVSCPAMFHPFLAAKRASDRSTCRQQAPSTASRSRRSCTPAAAGPAAWPPPLAREAAACSAASPPTAASTRWGSHGARGLRRPSAQRAASTGAPRPSRRRSRWAGAPEAGGIGGWCGGVSCASSWLNGTRTMPEIVPAELCSVHPLVPRCAVLTSGLITSSLSTCSR